MKRVVNLVTILIVLLIISGCNNPVNSELVGLTNVKNEDVASEINNENSITTSDQLVDLYDSVNTNIEIYDGVSMKDIEIVGEIYTSKFIQGEFLPFGLYIPDFLTEKKFHDGNEFEGQDHSLISLFERDHLNLDKLDIRDNLEEHENYIGSNIFDGPDQVRIKYEDFFSFSYEDNEVIIRLSYFEDQEETILPKFIDIIKNLKYIN